MVLERLWTGAGTFSADFSLEREGSIWEWGHPAAFLSPSLSSFWL